MSRQAILFDIDGTLVDSNDGHVAAWREAFRRAGYDFDPAVIHDQIGKGGDNLVPSLVPDADEDQRRQIDVSHGEIYKREHLPRVKPFPGARELLLRAGDCGKTVVLASSASREELDHYVELLDAASLIHGSASKDDVKHSKPCPDIFRSALDKSGCSPDQALVIGDTPYDIQAARRSGVDTIAVRSGRFPEEALIAERPVAIYDDVASLLAEFEQSPISR